jgi:LmbE family N-acetylglucosaminyl deacetylase
MARTVLVISPHALDEVLGCAGIMATHAANGDRVELLILFGDGTGRDAPRRIAADKAARLLGSRPPRFAGFPENRSDTVPLVDVIGAVERCVAEVKPELVYVPFGGSLNIDHRTTFRASVTALRPVPGANVKTIYAYEILSSSEWAPPGMSAAFRPARFVDISAQLDKKLEAVEAYGAEMRPTPHARSLDAVRVLAQQRGFTVGFAAAEAFEIVRDIRPA